MIWLYSLHNGYYAAWNPGICAIRKIEYGRISFRSGAVSFFPRATNDSDRKEINKTNVGDGKETEYETSHGKVGGHGPDGNVRNR